MSSKRSRGTGSVRFPIRSWRNIAYRAFALSNDESFLVYLGFESAGQTFEGSNLGRLAQLGVWAAEAVSIQHKTSGRMLICVQVKETSTISMLTDTQ